MSENSEKRKGEIFILLGGLIWAFFPIIIVLSYSHLEGLISLGWSTIFATIFFLLIILYRKSWQGMRSKVFWQYVAYVAFFNGILFYCLYYIGLKTTTAGNASLIGLIEILTSFVFFNMFKKEHISKEHKFGAVLMMMGALIVLFPNFSNFNSGDLFIFIAMFCGPIGNHFQQKARKIASVENILFTRYLISIPFIFLLAYLFNHQISFGFNVDSLFLLLVNGLLVFGISKIFWIEGIHRIPVTKAISISSVGPLLTLLLAWLILKQPPTIWQLTSFIPLFAGLLLLTDNYKFKNYNAFI